jgi:hypothetical protein
MKNIHTFEDFINENRKGLETQFDGPNRYTGKKPLLLMYIDRGGKIYWFEVIHPNENTGGQKYPYVWDQWDYEVLSPVYDSAKAERTIKSKLRGTGLSIDNFEDSSMSVRGYKPLYNPRSYEGDPIRTLILASYMLDWDSWDKDRQKKIIDSDEYKTK